jgi:peptidoglycan/LPS O-acetylase OafA/YrhL
MLPVVGLGGDEAANFWSGFPRVGASFFAGVATFHIDRASERHADFQRAFWFIVALTGLCFYYPYPLSLPVKLVWIALLSPLLVYTGSKVRLLGKIRSVALLGGELSYPIYALHYPIFCWMNGSYQAVTRQQNVVFEGPLMLGCVLFGSLLALKKYDEPLRKWLDRRATRGTATRAATL